MKKVCEEKLEKMFDEYVPAGGCAETKGGELVRAVNRIGYRYYNDGDHIGVDYGNETCNSAARYVMEIYSGTEMSEIVGAMWGVRNERMYESGVDNLVEATVSYLDCHPELFKTVNDYDYTDFFEVEDVDWYPEGYEEDMDEEELHDLCYRQMMEDISQYPKLSADR